LSWTVKATSAVFFADCGYIGVPFRRSHLGEVLEFLVCDMLLSVLEAKVSCLRAQLVEEVLELCLIVRPYGAKFEALTVSEDNLYALRLLWFFYPFFDSHRTPLFELPSICNL